MAMMSKRVGKLIVVVSDNVNPTDQEWDALLGLVRGATGSLVYSTGGVPTGAQRKRGADQGLVSLPVAVLTTSSIVRGALTALSWMGAQTRAFNPDEVQEGLVFLKVPESEQREVMSTFDRMLKTIRAA